MSFDCGPGEILRKSYRRKSYKKKDGTTVKGSKVSATCITDMGKIGKGEKTLPKLDNKIHLRDYGYNIHLSDKKRHQILNHASKDIGDPLMLLRHLNLIRNYQGIPEIKNIFDKDVEYMKKIYAREKKQRGGYQLHLRYCENSDKCVTINELYEEHIIDEKKMIFRGYQENDLQEIYDIRKEYLQSTENMDKVKKILEKYQDKIIVLLFEDQIKGYCMFEHAEKEVEIIEIAAENKFNTILIKFCDNLFYYSNVDATLLKLNLSIEYSIKILNIFFDFFYNAISFDKETSIFIIKKNYKD